MTRVLSITLILSLISCSSTTIIKTNSPGSKIYVNDEYKGSGSAVHTDMFMSWTTQKLKIVSENCTTIKTTFKKNEQYDIYSILATALLIFPIIWIKKYKAVRSYDLECEKEIIQSS